MYQAPICNSYVPMDYPDVFEYVPEPPAGSPAPQKLPMLLEGYDVEPCPGGTLLDKDDIIFWARHTLEECAGEPKATFHLTQLISYLITDE